MDAQLAAEIEVAEARWRHAIVLGKTRDPLKKIAAAKEEIAAKANLDALREEASKQAELGLAVGQPLPA